MAEVSLDVIKKTQKILSKHVKKPPLTEKLLKKPPFRFLHDLISNIIKETGFLKGLFSDEELLSDNIKEKDSKIAFLNKLIDAIRVITKTELSVRASKIVAGLEPTNTNLLLQALGNALESKLDSTDYIKQFNSRNMIQTDVKKSEKTNPATKDSKKKTKEKDITPKVSKNKKEDGTPRSKRNVPIDSSRNKIKDKSSIKRDSPRKAADKTKEKIIKDSPRKAKDTIQEKIRNDSLNRAQEKDTNEMKITDKNISLEINEELKSNFENNQTDFKIEPHTDKDQTTEDTNYEANVSRSTENKTVEENKISEVNENLNKTNLIRPKSARPKSGDKEKNTERHFIVAQETILKPLEMTVKQTSQRPKSSLRPPSVRPSSARPGAPRLRPDSALPVQEPVIMGNVKVIIETVDNADDEETVFVENAPEVVADAIDTTEMALNNKSHLVEQILEKIKEGDGHKKNIDIDWDSNSIQNKDGTKETSQLRNFIQNITKTANPLGKLLNYLHEDIDAMHGELQMWTNTKKQLFAEIQKQKRLSAESNKPLLAQLEQLKREIKKQQQEIMNVQSNIIKNDLRIKELLCK